MKIGGGDPANPAMAYTWLNSMTPLSDWHLQHDNVLSVIKRYNLQLND